MEETYDVVVLGSGAAGLTAALAAAVEGASVALFEKADKLGGTTALSGGTIWIPNNQPAREAGIEDSAAAGTEYMESLSLGMILPALLDALIAGGPKFVEFAERHADLRFELVHGYPDYHPERPGGLPGGGRSIEVNLVSFAELGEWAERVAGAPQRLQIREMPLGGGTGVLPDDVAAAREEAQLEGLGRGLVGGLLKACLAHGVVVSTGTRAMRLMTRRRRRHGRRARCRRRSGSSPLRSRGSGHGRVRIRRRAGSGLPPRPPHPRHRRGDQHR